MVHHHRAMLIGAIGAGKSTLINALLGREVKAVKTQSLLYHDWIVDTPGEYTENPMFYKNIMATSLEVTHVLYIQDATKKKMIFPPGFSSGINKMHIGVITKSDAEESNLEFAIAQLKQVILNGPIVITSAYKGEGIQEIRDLVSLKTLDEVRNYVVNSGSKSTLFV